MRDRPLLTYVLATLPRWTFAGAALWALQAVTLVPWGLSGALWAALVIADLAMFPVRRRYYESEPVERRLIGQVGVTVTAIGSEGRVRVRGELWRARAAAPVRAGADIRVIGVEGLTLVVEEVRLTPGATGHRSG